jgi:hypothetical protein
MEFVFGLALGKSGFMSLVDAFQLSQLREGYGFLHVFKSLVVGLFWTVLIFGSGLFGGLAFHNNRWKKRLLLAFPSFSLAVFSLYWVTITEESMYYALFGILFLMGFLSIHKTKKPCNPKINVLLLGLIFLPFFLHLGSNVYFMRLGVHYLFLWILWIMVWLKTYGEFQQFRITAFSIGIFLLPVAIDCLWLRPFDQKSIFHQTEKFVYQRNKTIYIDQEQLFFLQNLEVILEALHAENLEVLPLYAMPGPLYLLNRQIPKTPGIWNTSHFEAYFAKDFKVKVVLFKGLDSLPDGVQQNYLRYEHPEKGLIGVEIYVSKENHD